MTFRSPFVQHALALRDEARAAYEDHQYAQYVAADEACRGRLLNRRGEKKGIDSFKLFMGTSATAFAYASEELVEYWQYHPRVSFERFEQIMFETWLATGLLE